MNLHEYQAKALLAEYCVPVPPGRPAFSVSEALKAADVLGGDTIENGYIKARSGRLKGARNVLETVTVTGTENLMMAATLADGETVLENAALEPEVVDLAELLIAMGARIEGHGTHRIRIQGVERLHAPPQPHRIIPDRIEAGTFLCAVVAAGGDVRLAGARADPLEALIAKLREAGATIEAGEGWVRVIASGRPRAVDVRTSEYPAFPTDMQAQLMAVDCIAEGSAKVVETIFENRFMHTAAVLWCSAIQAVLTPCIFTENHAWKAIIGGLECSGKWVRDIEIEC